MIEKTVPLSVIDPLVSYVSDSELIKSAEMSNLLPEVLDVIRNVRANADNEKTYLLVVALGAGEYWGANRNGDYFPESALLKHHHTFKHAHVFKQHQNKDPKNAIGEVISAHYNSQMHRVELIISINKALAPDLYRRIVEENYLPDVSMGTKVPFDECSICHNRAKTRAEYCEHLKYQMGEILPDGRQVYAINWDPKFFDISVVRIGADVTAKALLKVAALEAEEDKRVQEKEAEISKEVPAEKVMKPPKILDDILYREKDIPPEILIRLRQWDLPDVLHSLAYMGIQLKPKELPYLLDDDFAYLPPMGLRRMMLGRGFGMLRPQIIHMLAPWLHERSYHYPFVVYRIARGLGPLRSIGYADTVSYGTYRDILPEIMEKRAALLDFKSVILLALLSQMGIPLINTGSAKKPATPMEIYVESLKEVAKNNMANNPGFSFEKNAARSHLTLGKSLLGGMITGHILSAKARKSNYEAVARGERPSEFKEFIGKHPNIVGATLSTLIWPKSRRALKALIF